MAVDVVSVVVLGLFYVAIVVVGVAASKLVKIPDGDPKAAMVAGRNLGPVIGILTCAATFVGGGYINGQAEGVATDGLGLVWTITPLGIFIGTAIGGVLYGAPMRKKMYVTMLDPLQEKYGHFMTGLLFIAALAADLFWAASILGALGTSLSVMVGLDSRISIVMSSVVAVLYTIMGQMVAVAYTDVLQLIFMVVGLVLCLPFAMTNSAVTSIADTASIWLGKVETNMSLAYIDYVIIQIFGSIPWQTFFQRLLSAKSVETGRVMAIIGGASAFLLGIPPALIGAIGVSTNWNETDLGYSPIENGETNMILPFVVQYLTPKPVSIMALAAIIAAVMSSLDSIVLSSSSMFTHNVYNLAIRDKASPSELLIVQRCSLLVTTAIATVLAIFVESIYTMFFLAADLVYVVMFPQLTAAVFLKDVNLYGSFVGYVLGLFLRLGGGDSLLGLKPIIYFPLYDEELGQLFPFKTLAMLTNFISIVIISKIARLAFQNKYLPMWMDVGNVFAEDKENILGNKDININHSNSQIMTSDTVESTKF